jgi:antitoxin YefM
VSSLQVWCSFYYQILYINLYIKEKLMITATISAFRKDMKSYLNKVTQNFETLIINRGEDSGVVVISLEEYNALQATQHELSSQVNEKRLDSAIAKFRQGQSFNKDLVEE